MLAFAGEEGGVVEGALDAPSSAFDLESFFEFLVGTIVLGYSIEMKCPDQENYETS